ncbi:MAG: hypothetical protein U9Q69_02165 [Nanoarchaeota archaeon]|nr:hypothetical protein [Nanoarchaeota archaeon]
MEKLEKELEKSEIKKEKPLYEPKKDYKGIEVLDEKDCFGGTGVKYWM